MYSRHVRNLAVHRFARATLSLFLFSIEGFSSISPFIDWALVDLAFHKIGSRESRYRLFRSLITPPLATMSQVVNELQDRLGYIGWTVELIVHDVERHPCDLIAQVSEADVLLTPHGFQVRGMPLLFFIFFSFVVFVWVNLNPFELFIEWVPFFFSSSFLCFFVSRF